MEFPIIVFKGSFTEVELKWQESFPTDKLTRNETTKQRTELSRHLSLAKSSV